jgi:hypothetical protein
MDEAQNKNKAIGCLALGVKVCAVLALVIGPFYMIWIINWIGANPPVWWGLWR